MNASLLWLLVPLAPLLAIPAIIIRPQAIGAMAGKLWICCVPALAASAVMPGNFSPELLWQSASWGQGVPYTAAWLAFTAALWMVAGIYAADSQRNDAHLARFWIFWLLALSGNLLLVIARDALSFYVGFSMMSLSAYGLVIHNGTASARRAGRLYLQLAITGEILLFGGMLLQAHAAESLLFEDWSLISPKPVAVLLLLTGLGLKAGFWPLHMWLPLAHPAAPAPASAVLSGAMIKAGILGLWLFLPPDASLPAIAGSGVSAWTLANWSQPLMMAAFFSAFYGVAAGLTRTDAKQVLAYSSVSQMGYLFFVIALSWQYPGQRDLLALILVLYVVHHGFAKGALFIAADLFKSGRFAGHGQRWLLMVLLAIPAFALAGFVFTSGAVAKTGLKSFLEDNLQVVWLPWLQAGALATSLLLARAGLLLLRMQDKAGATPVSQHRLISWAALCLMPLTLPWLWPEMRAGLLYTFSASKLFALVWPIVTGLLLAALALRLNWKVPAVLQRHPHPFLAVSLWLKRRMNQALLPSFEIPWRLRKLRERERRWNRYWQGGTVNRSAALLLIFVMVAGFIILLQTN
jgi:hydrogenase-4 component B